MRVSKTKFAIYAIKYYGAVMYLNGCMLKDFENRKNKHLDEHICIPKEININELDIQVVALYKSRKQWLKNLGLFIVKHNTLMCWNKIDSPLNERLLETSNDFKKYYYSSKNILETKEKDILPF